MDRRVAPLLILVYTGIYMYRSTGTLTRARVTRSSYTYRSVDRFVIRGYSFEYPRLYEEGEYSRCGFGQNI